MDYYKNSLILHEQHKGKWEMDSKVPVESLEDLSLAYTPGVAQPCIEIAGNREEVYKYTAKWNTVAIATDGSAALGLAISEDWLRFPSWRERPFCLRNLPILTRYPFALIRRIQMKS